MRILPVSSYSFGRKATQQEIEHLEYSVASARKNYSNLESRYLFGMPAIAHIIGKALYYGRHYARLDAGIFADIAERHDNYVDTLPSVEDKKKSPEDKALKTMEDKYREKKQRGVELYFKEHKEENEIISRAKDEFCTTEEGIKAAEKVRTAEDNLNRALIGEDIENIFMYN